MSQDRGNRYAQLRFNGYYAEGWAGHGDPLMSAKGIATLELVFATDVSNYPAGSVTDLAADGSHLEISVSFPVSMLSWADELLAGATDGVPLVALLSSDSDVRHRLNGFSLSFSEPRILPDLGHARRD
jgi:hypothetical protein